MRTYKYNTIIVGSGAAALNAADTLHSLGQHDIAIVTEGFNMGTSRNTGSDKQTYYKLTMAGDGADSITDMAQDFFKGGCMDGEHALIEAAMSARSFYKLALLGVPFPYNEYGEYVGYKTDHDPRLRATSAGPLTSKFMTECLEKSVKSRNIKIYDGYMVFGIIVEDGICKGVLALDKSSDDRYCLFSAKNVIYATGGPAGLYSLSVFPESQTGSSGIAFEAGVMGKNLTEWQYGIASIKFRWNLSGTYQQVLPKYISTDKDGNNPVEFLEDYFEDKSELLNNIFLKGYQWPFDPRKVNGSSRIDMLVYDEIQKGRRVFLDFRENPSSLTSFDILPEESHTYLKNSDALFGTPIQRLAKMNTRAIDLYKDHGIDLYTEPLEIAVCAQHNNGGLAVNENWETNIKNFFAVGEVAGTHGVYRPGGSALNSGQVGSTRAAQYVWDNCKGEPEEIKDCTYINNKIALIDKIINNTGEPNVLALRKEIGDRMSKHAAHIRSLEGLKAVLKAAKDDLKEADQQVIANIHELPLAIHNIDLLIAQITYVSAMIDYIEKGGGSRGSYLIGEGSTFMDMVQEVEYKNGEVSASWRKVRPIPERDIWFESVYNRRK